MRRPLALGAGLLALVLSVEAASQQRLDTRLRFGDIGRPEVAPPPAAPSPTRRDYRAEDKARIRAAPSDPDAPTARFSDIRRDRGPRIDDRNHFSIMRW